MAKYEKASGDSAYFNTIEIVDSFVKDWEVLYESSDHNKRLYVKSRNKGEGFEAVAVEFASGSGDYKDSWWDDTKLAVVIIFEATAYYDGIRHIEWYPLDEGYTNYPGVGDIAEMLQILSNKEKQECSCLY